MKIRTLGVVAAVVGISAGLLAQGARRDGRWEVKMEMSMPGMPAGLPPSTSIQCVTKEDAADPTKAAPQGPPGRGGPSDNCKMTDYKVDGNKVNYTMTCAPPQAGTMTGEFIYAEDSYVGTMKMDMSRGGQPMSMTMKYTGKRLGDCEKPEIKK